MVRTGLLSMVLMVSGAALAVPPAPPLLPQECQVTGSQSGIDFGELNKATTLTRKISMTVSCRHPERMKLRLDGGLPGRGFTLEQAGKLGLSLNNARLDNRAVSLRQDLTSPGTGLSVLAVVPGMRVVPDGGRESGRLLTFDLTVTVERKAGMAAPRQRLAPQLPLTVTLE
ncbi:TPA: hypothetical protein ACX3LH_000355 [Klebsiella michiganensis]